MIVGQDWGDVRYFTKNLGLEAPRNPTNETLRELISLLGIEVGPPEDRRRSGVAFFTNAVLCLKDGGLQADVQSAWFANCSSFLGSRSRSSRLVSWSALENAHTEVSPRHSASMPVFSVTLLTRLRELYCRTGRGSLRATTAAGGFRTPIARSKHSGGTGFGWPGFFDHRPLPGSKMQR
jgi:hypothetical protein